MRVPVHPGLRQEVAAAHRHRVALDDRPHALALDDEPERVLGVAVLGRVLAGHQVLDRGPQRRRRVRASAQARVRQRDRPPLAAAADRAPGRRSARPARAGAPTPTGAAAAFERGLLRHQVTDPGPQRDQQLLLEAAVQILQLRCGRRLVGPILGSQLHR